MKIRRIIPLIIIPLLFACHPKKPEIPTTEVPAGPLVHALEQRGESFSSLKALASVRIVRKGRKRVFESSAVLLRGQEQFRIEAYGPLGETLMTLVWSGEEMLLDLEGRRRLAGRSELARLIGADVDPAELAAVLAGNIPAAFPLSTARLFCSPEGICVLELRDGDRILRVHHQGSDGEADPFTIRFFRIYQGDRLVYQARFSNFAEISGYSLPQAIVMENPGKRVSLTVQYLEAEVNAPLDARLFMISGAGAAGR